MSDSHSNGGGTPPSEESRDLEITDRALLAALSNRQKDVRPLTPEQERSIDAWVRGELVASEDEEVSALVKRNIYAAERVVEQRLWQAAHKGPAVPPSLERSILSVYQQAPPRPKIWWSLRTLRWHWAALAGAVAVAVIVVAVDTIQFRPELFLAPRVQSPRQESNPYAVPPASQWRLAMATITDRGALFEPTDIRMRGVSSPHLTSPSSTGAALRFRDVEVPVSAVKEVLESATRGTAGSIPQAIADALIRIEGPIPQGSRLIVDSALKDKVEAGLQRDRIALRIYDLSDPRTNDIRSSLGDALQAGPAYFLTIKP